MKKHKYKSDIKVSTNGKAYSYPDFTNVSARISKDLLVMIDKLAVKNRRKRSAMMLELVREALIERGMMENDKAICN